MKLRQIRRRSAKRLSHRAKGWIYINGYLFMTVEPKKFFFSVEHKYVERETVFY